ncbi:MAG: rhodanese-like domain-containing protein [Dehalococcoidia bacterium]
MATEPEIRQEPGEPFKRITAKGAKELMEEGDTAVIDVRNPDEYATGHIPGAKLIPVNDLFSRVDELDKDKRLLFVCSVGVRSALACEVAAACGYTDLYNIEGGTDAWIDNQYQVEA